MIFGDPLEHTLREKLLSSLGQARNLWAPCLGKDGICRLQTIGAGPFPALAQPTMIPLKKLLLPYRETVWRYQSGRFRAAEMTGPFAVVGVTLCELQAVWYLDQVFAADESYQTRRANRFLVGMPCEPDSNCRCDQALMPLAGDIFIDQEQAWALSTAGEAVLHACGCTSQAEGPLPWPVGMTAQRPAITPEQYAAASDAPVWAEAASHCLSCGACSAVCPTCYCFDMLDDAALDGTVSRSRIWDNCFFAEHGKVAGGYDFRPGRAARLRFRMEHKFFGFGSLRGQNSCVGCGRCRKACPVDIDLDQIAARLKGEEGS